MTVDRRTLPSESSESVHSGFRKILEDLGAGESDFRWDLHSLNESPPMEISPDEAVVQSLGMAAEEVLGRRAEIGIWSATSDAGIMCREGIPSVIFGPGSLSRAHKPDEWVEIDEVVNAARIYALAIIDLLA
jgi:succinyl-diaminopimelate desuccinylase